MKEPFMIAHDGKTRVYHSDNPIPVEQAMENIAKTLSRLYGMEYTIRRKNPDPEEKQA